MKKAVFAVGALSIGMVFGAAGASQAGIKEGEWSMTTTIKNEAMDEQSAEAMQEMENMSPEERAMAEQMMGSMGINMGGGGEMVISNSYCITNENPVPASDDDEDCEKTHTMRGNTVNFSVICDDTMSTGQITYKNTTMKGTVNSTETANGQVTTIELAGEYVGPCNENTALDLDNPAVQGLAEKEIAIKEKELDLKRQELELQQKEIDMRAAAQNKKGKPSINDVNNAVNTTNSVKSTLGGIRSIFGR